MASEEQLQALADSVARLDAVDTVKLLREDLGVESLHGVFAEDLAAIQSLAAFAKRHAASVHNTYVGQARSTLDHITNEMNAQVGRSSAEYINERDAFLSFVRGQVEEAKLWLPSFAGSAVLERGFLEDEGIRREYERVVKDLRVETDATLTRVKEQADKAVADAKKLADEIESRARKSATRMSVDEAQRQFSSATKELQKKADVWAGLAASSVLVLLVLPIGFMFWWPLPDADNWSVALYHTLLRVFMLSASGAAVTVCVRLFRAHLHMVEKNRHRVRVANSIESFVNSALEPQQRDLLLAKLAEAVIDFGDSGIIKNERDEPTSSTTSGDLAGRILAALSVRRGA